MLDLEISNVTLNYGFKNVLDGVTFQVNSGDKVAIIGGNGAGKTSIFNIIAGIETPSSGTVSKRRNATVGFLTQIAPEQERGVTVRDFLRTAFGEISNIQARISELEKKMADSDISEEELNKVLNSYGQAQDMFMNMGGYEVEANIEKMAANLKITEFLDQEYMSLSGGQKTICCLTRLLLNEPDILLLDEPTNHLDIPTLVWLENFIKAYTGSVILISHDRYFLDKTIGKVFAISDGKVKAYVGNYTKYVEAYKAECELQEQAYVTQQKKIADMEETIRKNRSWGAQSSEKGYRVAKQLERRIEEMDKVDRPKVAKDMALTFNQEARSGKKVLKIRDLSFAYDDDIIICGADLELKYQDKVCLIGKNGSGKTTVLKIVLGMLEEYEGVVELGSNVKIGYLPQHVQFEDESITILEEFQRHFNGTTTKAYSTLAAFHFCGEEVHKRISALSGGEKVKLKFAELVQDGVNFLVLDEPTNHLDVNNREVLEEALNEFVGTLLFVSHDRYFINKVSNKVVELEEGKFVTYMGDYDYYYEHKKHD